MKTIMKKMLVMLGILVLISIAALGTYFATKHYTFKSAYIKGHNAGQDVGYKRGYKKGYDIGWDKGKNTEDFHFQPLYSIPNPTPPTSPSNQSFNCTSSNYGGSTTYTNCN
jgi:hypothetical protein